MAQQSSRPLTTLDATAVHLCRLDMVGFKSVLTFAAILALAAVVAGQHHDTKHNGRPLEAIYPGLAGAVLPIGTLKQAHGVLSQLGPNASELWTLPEAWE